MLLGVFFWLLVLLSFCLLLFLGLEGLSAWQRAVLHGHFRRRPQDILQEFPDLGLSLQQVQNAVRFLRRRKRRWCSVGVGGVGEIAHWDAHAVRSFVDALPENIREACRSLR